MTRVAPPIPPPPPLLPTPLYPPASPPARRALLSPPPPLVLLPAVGVGVLRAARPDAGVRSPPPPLPLLPRLSLPREVGPLCVEAGPGEWSRPSPAGVVSSSGRGHILSAPASPPPLAPPSSWRAPPLPAATGRAGAATGCSTGRFTKGDLAVDTWSTPAHCVMLPDWESRRTRGRGGELIPPSPTSPSSSTLEFGAPEEEGMGEASAPTTAVAEETAAVAVR